MAPGGYRFSDYARVGAPLELLILATAVPMIAMFEMKLLLPEAKVQEEHHG